MPTTTKPIREDKAQMIKSALPVKNTILTGKSGRKYKILEVLGAGGFGITYKAVAEVKLENGMTASMFFAIKEHFMKGCYRDADRVRVICPPTMQTDVEQSREDFRTEAERLMKLNGQSPNIVKVNEWFDANGTRYYVMEYLDGQTLEQYVGGRPQPEAKALSLLLPVAHAVELVHKEKLLHLDIKPDNIVLKTDIASGVTIPVLIDFGLAKHFDKNGKPTSHLVAKGATEGYAPIEQYAEIARFAPEIDVYALGATLFFLLTGQNPPKAFDIQTVTTLMERLPADVSPRVTEALMGAMQRNNFDRTQTVAEFIVALEGAGYDALPVGYVLRGKNNESYVITEVVGFTDGYITYKARLGSSYTAGSGATLPFKEYYLFEWFYKDWDVRRPDGSLEPREFRKPWYDGLLPPTTPPWRLNPKLEPVGSFETNNTVYSICPVNRRSSLLSLFKKKRVKLIVGFACCLLVVLSGVYAYFYYTFEGIKDRAMQGDAWRQWELGNYYQYGFNIAPQNDSLAVFWYTKSAEGGIADAQYRLGTFYQHGECGVSQDDSVAVFWFIKAAENGSAPAQSELENYGIVEKDEPDKENATSSSVKQETDVKSAEKTEKNLSDAELFVQARTIEDYMALAEKGYAPAQFRLGRCYYNGNGVSTDYEKAVYWYTKAAEQGDSDAQFHLGDCYRLGFGVSRDYEKTVYWYTKAAEQGNAWAQYYLGHCYYDGSGVSMDREKAVYWFTKSAEQGNVEAQYSLGFDYERGIGVSQDYSKAVYWYTKAAKQGDNSAQNALERLNKQTK